MRKRDIAAAAIRQWLDEGRYKPGDKLPSILELARILNMTDQPVRKALAQLKMERLVRSRNGVGLFVLNPESGVKRIMVLSNAGMDSIDEDEVNFPAWEVYHGVSQEIAAKKYDSCLCVVADHRRDPATLVKKFNAENCDGVICFDSNGETIFDAVAGEIGYERVVSAEYGDQRCRFNSVRVDFSRALKTMLEKAYELGHRRFAMLYATNISRIWSHMERYRCFMEVAQERQLEIAPSDLIRTKGDAIDGYRATMRLLDRADPPSLIFAVTDLRAKGVLRALKDRGLTPGKEVSVIGFDGMPGTDDWDLATVDIPRREIGREALRLLDRCLELGRTRELVKMEARPVFKSSLGPV